jgi:hypothetical protein
MQPPIETVEITELGAGILIVAQRHGDRLPKILSHNGRLYNRFMDQLFLPCSTEDLSIAQIKVINRFREARFASDPQFILNLSVKRRVAAALLSISAKSIVEVGCGRFPITQYLRPVSQYLCVEIDDQAITENCRLGIDCQPLESFESAESLVLFDAFVALFVFQFHVSDELVTALRKHIRGGGIGIFNLHDVTPELRNRRIDAFQRSGWTASTFHDVHPRLLKNEFVVLSDPETPQRLKRIGTLQSVLLSVDANRHLPFELPGGDFPVV